MTKKPPPLPVVLELAPLPREQVGPFLLLGLDKTADANAVEARWAERVIRARKGSLKVLLADVNWAREVLRDNDRRARADAASMNPDLACLPLAATLEQLNGPNPTAHLKDDEKGLADYGPQVQIPDFESERSKAVVPEVPVEFPVAMHLLRQFTEAPLDPWDLPGPWPRTTGPAQPAGAGKGGSIDE